MSREVAIFDLDSALFERSPLPAFAQAAWSTAAAQGLARGGEALYRLLDLAGGPLLAGAAVRVAARGAGGWDVAHLTEVGENAAGLVQDRVAPFARVELDEHRAAGRRIVGTTVLPSAMASALATRLGFDGVVATRLAATKGRLTGRLEGPVVWGRGKLVAARTWAAEHGANLRASHAYAGRIHDAALLAAVRHPTVIDPDAQLALLAWLRGWPTRSFQVPPGVRYKADPVRERERRPGVDLPGTA